MEDKWTNRDLPVLRAIVEIYENTGAAIIRAFDVEQATGFDKETTQRALRALNTQPYFQPGIGSSGGEILSVGPPTGDALRLAGAWPSPEGLVDRLITAFEAAAEDEDRAEPERGKLKQLALGLRGAAYQVAIGALGGASGNILSS